MAPGTGVRAYRLFQRTNSDYTLYQHIELYLQGYRPTGRLVNYSGMRFYIRLGNEDITEWSTPAAVKPSSKEQFFPWMSSAPNGRVDVVFYDRSCDPSGDKLTGSCTGKGTPPVPKGSEDWACDATGGTGKFAQSRGRWTLHIVISRVWNKNGTQKNRFTETGMGRISWNASG